MQASDECLFDQFLTNDDYLSVKQRDQIVDLIIKAVVLEEKEKIPFINDFLLTEGYSLITELPIEIIHELNNFECLYYYTQNKKLNQNELNYLTEWVASNGHLKQKERFMINIPYVDVERLERDSTMTKSIKQKKLSDNGKLSIDIDLNQKEISALTNWAITNNDSKGLCNFVKEHPYIELKRIELAIIKKAILEENIKYLYQFARDIAGANKELLELGMLIAYDSMSEIEKFQNVKYLFHYNHKLESKKEAIIEDKIKESTNLEYVAYQIVYKNSEKLLEQTFGNYEQLYRFSLSCKDFFEEKKLYEEYLPKVQDAFINGDKKKVLKKSKK